MSWRRDGYPRATMIGRAAPLSTDDIAAVHHALALRLDGRDAESACEQADIALGYYRREVVNELTREAYEIEAGLSEAERPHSRAVLVRYLAGLIREADEEEIRQHLAGCPACATFLDALRVRAEDLVERGPAERAASERDADDAAPTVAAASAPIPARSASPATSPASPRRLRASPSRPRVTSSSPPRRSRPPRCA